VSGLAGKSSQVSDAAAKATMLARDRAGGLTTENNGSDRSAADFK
jgi:hypothetical protein